MRWPLVTLPLIPPTCGLSLELDWRHYKQRSPLLPPTQWCFGKTYRLDDEMGRRASVVTKGSPEEVLGSTQTHGSGNETLTAELFRELGRPFITCTQLCSVVVP